MKAMFHSSAPRLFRTTLIGHLYEVCQDYPTILLSEKLDQETNNVLSDKSLFPNLIATEPVRTDYTGKFNQTLTERFRHHSYLHGLAERLIKQYKPDVVIVENDVFPFEMYLLRAAKKQKAFTIALQSSAKLPIAQSIIFLTRTWATEKLPGFLPLSLRLMLIKIQRLLGHFLTYWIIPILTFSKPFPGPTSYVTWNHVTGRRQADRYVVLSKAYYDQFIKEGVDESKLLILDHPLTRKPRNLFKKAYNNTFIHKKGNSTHRKILTIVLPSKNSGFDRQTLNSIEPTELFKLRISEVICTVSQVLPSWIIYLKPHPNYDLSSMPSAIDALITDNVLVANQYDPMDKYIEMSQVIIAPPPVTSVLLTAKYQRPEIVLLAVNLAKEFGAEFYGEFPGVQYIEDKETLRNILSSLKSSDFTEVRPQMSADKASLTLPQLIHREIAALANGQPVK
ncbi:MAG: hypothetical protein CL896_00560 [Dehalococcoidia bacterium]|nr:hypothetical protein [Dehalococcoidia bacterium]|tara:strand:- start:3993 stop:5345 length:1353 start_codon:yes stop_codon:yes gene_type:complete